MKYTLKSVQALAATLITFGSLAGGANAAILWNWEFGSNTGTLTTTGSSPIAGEYYITDFSVISSGDGALIGSIANNVYDISSDLDTGTTISLVWDGGNVTAWKHDGSNTFNWVIFEDTNDTEIYFGWEAGGEAGNINTALSAAIDSEPPLADSFTLNVAPVPEPSSVFLVGLGALGLVVRRRRD